MYEGWTQNYNYEITCNMPLPTTSFFLLKNSKNHDKNYAIIMICILNCTTNAIF